MSKGFRFTSVTVPGTERSPWHSIHQLVADGAEARAAVGAAVPAAVARGHLGPALPPLVQQELLGDARAHVIRRQLVPLSVLTGRDLVDRRPRLRERRIPGGLREHLGPRVETRAGSPGALDHVGKI